MLYETRDGIAIVRMNRPDSLNALDAGLAADLAVAFRQAAADSNVRAMVLAGEGRAFCSGGDLKAMAAGLASRDTERHLGAILRNFHELIAFLWELELPVVGAVHGAAVGGGMSLALACDFRIAAEDARFSQAFIKLGLTPDGGSTWLLPRLVGPARAAMLAMTGETLDARTALEWGLVNEVTPAGDHLPRAMELAGRLAGFSPHAMRYCKRLLRASGRSTFPEQLEAEAAAQVANASTDEFRAALAAFQARTR